MAPKVPWLLTLSTAQRATIDRLGDLILPADERSSGAGKLGVGAFVDEWISAPYPIQRHDREQVLGGLMWLDAQSRALHGAAFDAIPPAQRAALLDALTVTTPARSEEHTSELQSLMRISYAVFCLNKHKKE